MYTLSPGLVYCKRSFTFVLASKVFSVKARHCIGFSEVYMKWSLKCVYSLKADESRNGLLHQCISIVKYMKPRMETKLKLDVIIDAL